VIKQSDSVSGNIPAPPGTISGNIPAPPRTISDNRVVRKTVSENKIVTISGNVIKLTADGISGGTLDDFTLVPAQRKIDPKSGESYIPSMRVNFSWADPAIYPIKDRKLTITGSIYLDDGVTKIPYTVKATPIEKAGKFSSVCIQNMISTGTDSDPGGYYSEYMLYTNYSMEMNKPTPEIASIVALKDYSNKFDIRVWDSPLSTSKEESAVDSTVAYLSIDRAADATLKAGKVYNIKLGIFYKGQKSSKPAKRVTLRVMGYQDSESSSDKT
jgi:hypothetical protein